MAVGRVMALSLAVLTLCTCRHAPPPALAPSPDQEQEAITVLQGTDTVLFFSPRVVTLVADAIRNIRKQYPEVSYVYARPGRPAIAMMVAGLAAPKEEGHRTDRTSRPQTVKRTGLAEFDALLDTLQVDSVSIMAEMMVEVSFSSAANAPVIARHFARLPHVAIAVDDAPGADDGDWIRLRRKGSLFLFLFSAGGRNRTYFTYTFDTVSKTITPGIP